MACEGNLFEDGMMRGRWGIQKENGKKLRGSYNTRLITERTLSIGKEFSLHFKHIDTPNQSVITNITFTVVYCRYALPIPEQ